MYTVFKKQFGPYEGIEIAQEGSGACVLILPEAGGTVARLSLVPEGMDGPAVEVLAGDGENEAERNPWFRGRVLFPFNDRVRKGTYIFEGKKYTMEINDPEYGDAIHGFLYREKMEQVSFRTDEKGGGVILKKRLPGYRGYPFTPEISVEYFLSGSSFSLGFTVTNHGDAPLPFSLGWHPYFSFPEGKAGTWKLEIPAGEIIEVDERLVPTGSVAGVEGTPFDFRKERPAGEADLDTCFVNSEGRVSLRNGGRVIKILQSGDLFPCSQVFVPPSRDSIAVEPVSAAPDAFNNPELGLRVLQPGDSIAGTVRVVVSEGTAAG